MSKAITHGTVSGYRYHGCRCDPCRLAHNAKCYEYRAAHPEKISKYQANYTKSRYGLRPEEYDEILLRQGGGCAICGSREPGGHGAFHVDHDHSCCPDRNRSCGKCVRGLLCTTCNTSLGGFKDSTEVLGKAINYLNRKARLA